MICVKCGSQMENGVRFCACCGNDFSANMNQRQEAFVQQNEYNQLDAYSQQINSVTDYQQQSMNGYQDVNQQVYGYNSQAHGNSYNGSKGKLIGIIAGASAAIITIIILMICLLGGGVVGEWKITGLYHGEKLYSLDDDTFRRNSGYSESKINRMKSARLVLEDNETGYFLIDGTADEIMWSLEDDILKIRKPGSFDVTEIEYNSGKLVASSGVPSEFRNAQLEKESSNSNRQVGPDISGEWKIVGQFKNGRVYSLDDDDFRSYSGYNESRISSMENALLVLDADGTGYYLVDDEEEEFIWSYADGGLAIRKLGSSDVAKMEYVAGNLVASSGVPSVFKYALLEREGRATEYYVMCISCRTIMEANNLHCVNCGTRIMVLNDTGEYVAKGLR